MLFVIGIPCLLPRPLHLFNDRDDDHRCRTKYHRFVCGNVLNCSKYHICDKKDRNGDPENPDINKNFPYRNCAERYRRQINILPVSVQKFSYRIIPEKEYACYRKCDEDPDDDKSYGPSRSLKHRNKRRKSKHGQNCGNGRNLYTYPWKDKRDQPHRGDPHIYDFIHKCSHPSTSFNLSS